MKGGNANRISTNAYQQGGCIYASAVVTKLFFDYAKNNFRLTDCSPLVDNGDDDLELELVGFFMNKPKNNNG